MVSLPVKPCSSRSRSKIRVAECRCFFGSARSASRIWSMIGMNGSSFGRAGAFDLRYPGGTECSRIFRTVLRSMPKTRAASLLLILSTWHARRTRLYRSTEYISPPSTRCLRRKVRNLTPRRSDQPTASAVQFVSGIYRPAQLQQLWRTSSWFTPWIQTFNALGR